MEQEIIDFVNEIIENEHGNPISLEQKLVESEVDSFGIVMIFLELDQKYGKFSKEFLDTIDIPNYTLQDVVNRIIDGTD